MPRSSFVDSTRDRVSLWIGDPTDQAAHDSLLAALSEISPNNFDPAATLNNRLMGNLGEFITFFVGKNQPFADARPMLANALAPLTQISRPDVDIMWLVLPDQQTLQSDFVVIQEVKTTCASNLS